MTLSEKLMNLANESAKKKPEEINILFKKATEELKATSIEEKALKVGDKIPSFTLRNAYGKEVSSNELLQKGSLVINFYRGKWCPYCNLELQEYASALDKLEALDATLVAISPELPDKDFSDKLDFEILSDLGSKVARKFNLVFQVDSEVEKIYKTFGIDLQVANGDDSKELPMPATYVVNKDGIVVLSFVNADYTKRLDIEEVLDKLKELN
ncbi:MAG: peroxiredoxin-like family protein [Sarcina sp.]